MQRVQADQRPKPCHPSRAGLSPFGQVFFQTMENRPSHRPRIGTFFLLIGLFLLLLFLGSGFSRQPSFLFLFLSLISLLIGFLFRRNAPRPSSGRFDMIRKAIEGRRRRQDEKKK